MVTGKKVLEYEGYTYCSNYRSKSTSRWICSSYPTCRAFVLTDNDLMIIKKNTCHNHTKRILYKTKDGQYARL